MYLYYLYNLYDLQSILVLQIRLCNRKELFESDGKSEQICYPCVLLLLVFCTYESSLVGQISTGHLTTISV